MHVFSADPFDMHFLSPHFDPQSDVTFVFTSRVQVSSAFSTCCSETSCLPTCGNLSTTCFQFSIPGLWAREGGIGFCLGSGHVHHSSCLDPGHAFSLRVSRVRTVRVGTSCQPPSTSLGMWPETVTPFCQRECLNGMMVSLTVGLLSLLVLCADRRDKF